MLDLVIEIFDLFDEILLFGESKLSFLSFLSHMWMAIVKSNLIKYKNTFINISYIHKYYKFAMDDDDFQMIVSKEDYDKLKEHEKNNQEMTRQNEKMAQEIKSLKETVKDLRKSIYVRDSYIHHVLTECEFLVDSLLNTQPAESEISQSFYQDIVSFEQNGISSIELRDALELFKEENYKLFSKMGRVIEEIRKKDKSFDATRM